MRPKIPGPTPEEQAAQRQARQDRLTEQVQLLEGRTRQNQIRRNQSSLITGRRVTGRSLL